MRWVRVSTNGGKPAKERMFERRVAQEAAKAKPPVVVGVAKMGFGKYAGMNVTEVETGYLAWCLEKMDHCPLYILDELQKRGHGDAGSAWLAKQKSPRQQSRDRKKSASLARAKRQREHSLQSLESLKSGVPVTGSEFVRLHDEFVRADGDPDACPFDTDDYTYVGPTIGESGGKLVIVSCEFPERHRR